MQKVKHHFDDKTKAKLLLLGLNQSFVTVEGISPSGKPFRTTAFIYNDTDGPVVYNNLLGLNFGKWFASFFAGYSVYELTILSISDELGNCVFQNEKKEEILEAAKIGNLEYAANVKSTVMKFPKEPYVNHDANLEILNKSIGQPVKLFAGTDEISGVLQDYVDCPEKNATIATLDIDNKLFNLVLSADSQVEAINYKTELLDSVTCKQMA